jgi:hypothetical protein
MKNLDFAIDSALVALLGIIALIALYAVIFHTMKLVFMPIIGG